MTPPRRTPRTVHLVWLGSPLPARVERLRDDVARHDPDVEVRVWTDEDLGWLRNRDLLAGEMLYAAKADIARYEILQRHGGLYLDADFRVHRSLADVFAEIDRHGVVVARQSRTVYTNAFIGAVPDHPLLTDLVTSLPDSIRWTGRMTEPATTGPHYLTERLVHHLRAGGEALELPQHSVFPWGTDEEPLPTSALPASVIMSHDWSSLRSWSWSEVTPDPATVPVPDRRSRRRRTGRRPRTRAAATPLVHHLVARAEARLLTDRPGGGAPEPVEGLTPTQLAIERWTARRIVEHLSGSARFVDLFPPSGLPLVTTTRMLDRPGSAVAVVEDADPARLDGPWRDPSVRCSVHLVACAPGDADQVLRIESHGSTLRPRTLTSQHPPLGCVDRVHDLTLAALLQGLPRCDLVRVEADRLTPAVTEHLLEATSARRIARLLVTVDPLSSAPGVTRAAALLEALGAHGLPLRVGPWLVDGRGRTWWAHLRITARPFAVMVG